MANEEYNPLIYDQNTNGPDENFYFPDNKQAVAGIRNFIDASASFVNVTGSNNNVGKDCRYVDILNSSGCIVQGGCSNVTILNSSGVIVTQSNQIIINSRVHPNGKYKIIEANYNLVSDDEAIEFIGSGATQATINDSIFTTSRILRFVNAGSANLTISVASGIIGNSGAATTKVITAGNACAIIFNGTNWRVLHG